MRPRNSAWLPLALLFAIAAAPSDAADEQPAYVLRGRQTEIRQRALHERIASFHVSLSVVLQRAAPDLLAKLKSPPANVYGYQIQPQIAPDVEVSDGKTEPRVVRFSWNWSDTLIERERATIDRLETELKALASSGAPDRMAFERLIAEFKRVTDGQRSIDDNIEYNWLWQERIARDRPLYDRLHETQRKAFQRQALDAALDANDDDRLRTAAAAAGLFTAVTTDGLRSAVVERVQSLNRDLVAATGWADPPDFVLVEKPAPGDWLVTVPVFTDVMDARFLEEFRNGAEAVWHVPRSGVSAASDQEFRVRLTIETMQPEDLYCGAHAALAAPSESCEPPAKGEHIDLEAHLARFPANGVVLTTGATTLRWIGDRGIVLGPYDVSARVLAHELGHALGFPDAYFRGYRDLGPDGFEVTELSDLGDIMSAPGSGPVLTRHFDVLISAKARALLNRSFELYQQERFGESVAAARNALSLEPDYPEAFNNLAASYCRLARWAEAIVAANEALRLRPAFQLARNNLKWAEAGMAQVAADTAQQ